MELRKPFDEYVFVGTSLTGVHVSVVHTGISQEEEGPSLLQEKESLQLPFHDNQPCSFVCVTQFQEDQISGKHTRSAIRQDVSNIVRTSSQKSHGHKRVGIRWGNNGVGTRGDLSLYLCCEQHWKYCSRVTAYVTKMSIRQKMFLFLCIL